jgi:hypothetical protein
MAKSTSTVLTTLPEFTYDANGDLLLTQTYEPANQLLVARWSGIATPESVQTGVQAALAFAQRHPGVRIALSDGSQIAGDWLDLLPWVRYEFLPAFMTAGVRALAFLPSDDAHTRLGMIAFAEAAGALFPVRTYESESTAREWLAQFLG